MNTEVYSAEKFNAAIRAGHGPALLRELKAKHGIAFDESLGDMKFLTQTNFDMALDAQSELVTVGSAGIPAFLANYLDPKVIDILVSPLMAAKIAGEAQKGDWLTETAMFLTGEHVGEVSAYGDYSMNGASNFNVNFPQRQNYLFQAFLQYGQRELGIAGLAKLDWASQQQRANALVLMKYLNYVYFFGVANLQNYGLINDPNLPASITPTYSWITNASATANTVYQDIVRLYVQLQYQTNGVVNNDDPMVLALSPIQSTALKYVTTYNTNSVENLLKQNFPRLRIETAVQYTTSSGPLVQLIVEELDGQRTLEACFSSKLMAHNMVVETTSWKQKRSSGGFGTIWYRPMLCASMLG
jgi:hypothetical protein